MKTCSFRYARPHTLNESLFCIQEPEPRYELAACGNCGLCYAKYDKTYQRWTNQMFSSHKSSQ